MDYSTVARPLEGTPDAFVFSLDSLYGRLCRLSDRRKARGVRYPLAFLLTVMALAKLAGADKPCAIADWVAERAALFARLFELKRPAMPSHHTYRRLLHNLLVVDEWEQLVTDFLADLPQAGAPVQITLDGKTLRGTLAWGESRGLQLLAAYWPETGRVLCQVEVDPTTNEIGAAPLVLKRLDLPGKILTGDAMYAQREFSQAIGDAGGDYVWTAKHNQPNLRADIEKMFAADTSLVKGFNTGPTDYRSAQTIEKGHGRLERRTLVVTGDLQASSDWPYLAQVFRIERTTTIVASGQVRHEVAYGLTSLTAAEAGPERLLQIVRTHWQQENGLHYRRDVTFQEDATRLKATPAARALATLNNLALGLLAHLGYASIPQARRHFDAHPDEGLQMLLQAPSRL
jgi:predicted transposase YbfD/YdcC